MKFDTALIAAAFALLLSGCTLEIPRDDTDPPSGPRSGLVVFIDHLTGCEYLALSINNTASPLTPRLQPDGKPVCRGVER